MNVRAVTEERTSQATCEMTWPLPDDAGRGVGFGSPPLRAVPPRVNPDRRPPAFVSLHEPRVAGRAVYARQTSVLDAYCILNRFGRGCSWAVPWSHAMRVARSSAAPASGGYAAAFR